MLTLALSLALAVVSADSSPAKAVPLASSRSAIFARDPEPVVATPAPDTARSPAFEQLASQLLALQARATRADSQVFALSDSLRRMRQDSVRADSLARRAALAMAALSDSLARFRVFDSNLVELDTTAPADSTLRPDVVRLRVLLGQAALRAGRSVRTSPEPSGFRTGRLLRMELRKVKDSTWIRLSLQGPRDTVVVDRRGRAADREDMDLVQRDAARGLFGPVAVPPEPAAGVSDALRAAILLSVLAASLLVVFGL